MNETHSFWPVLLLLTKTKTVKNQNVDNWNKAEIISNINIKWKNFNLQIITETETNFTKTGKKLVLYCINILNKNYITTLLKLKLKW